MPKPPANRPTVSEPRPVAPSPVVRFLAALQFLTRVPVTLPDGQSSEFYQQALRGGVVFFPLVGAGVGAITAAAALALSNGVTPLLCAVLALAIEAMLSGGFHEDALADTFDALGGGWTRERMLEIMTDSRVGTYGALALFFGVAIRVVSLAALLPLGWTVTLSSLVAASALGRVAIVILMTTTPPVSGRESLAKDVAGQQTFGTLGVAGLLVLPVLVWWVLLMPIVAGLTVVVSLGVLAWYRRIILKRIGGTTGDLLGASAYLVQATVLAGSTWGLSS